MPTQLWWPLGSFAPNLQKIVLGTDMLPTQKATSPEEGGSHLCSKCCCPIQNLQKSSPSTGLAAQAHALSGPLKTRMSKRPAQALWLTVGGLGDRDTTCAIVGGIVACYTGSAAIPPAWRDAREPLPPWPFEDKGDR